MKLKIKKIVHTFLKYIKWTFWGFFLLSFISVLLYKFFNPPITPLMIKRIIEQALDNERKVRLKKSWVSIDKMSPNLVNAVIASEDNLFMQHYGFDFKAMKKAYANNKKGKKIKGASTISQQTAKNVFLFPSRNYTRKIFEAYFTILIELLWSKKRILEVYLNIIEMGDGIYGAEMASQYYFKKHASQLTKSQAALIAACLPQPLKRNPAHPTSYLAKRKNKILDIMNKIEWVNFTTNNK